MVAVKMVYDHEHGEAPLVVDTPSALREALDEVARIRKMALVSLVVADDARSPGLDVGLDGARGVGVLYYSGGDHWEGLVSRRDDAPAAADSEIRLYYYMDNDTEFPVSAEVTLDSVVSAALEFLATGGQLPTGVQWQRRPESVAGDESEWPD